MSSLTRPPREKPGVIVPAIPPIETIADPATREAIRAIVDGWQTRNGHKGSGEHRFLTLADLRGLDFRKLGNKSLDDAGLGGGGGPGTGPGGTPKPGQIAAIINDLTAQVIESPLFRDLGESIALITKPTTGIIARIENSEIGLLREIDNRVNADTALSTEIVTRWTQTMNSLAIVQNKVTTLTNNYSALASQVSTIQSSVNNNTIAIQQEATTRATADGLLQAQWTVKIDANGYVSGFGLASTVSNGVPYSEFYIRADRFAIGSPGVPRVPANAPPPPANVPFIVNTTNWTDSNGNVNPPGVYIKQAVIQGASIDTAKIRFAAVGTLQIGNDAVTVPSSRFDGTLGNLLGPDYNGATECIRVAVDYSRPAGDSTTPDSAIVPRSRFILFNCIFQSYAGGVDGDLSVLLRRKEGRYNAVTGQYEPDPNKGFVDLWSGSISVINGFTTAFPAAHSDIYPMSPGVHFYFAFAWTTSGQQIRPVNRSILVLGTKR